jgi:glycosyltransferase involved in cell wall biosynthesis
MGSSSISVVIIFLNGEAFLAEAIDSVRLQTHSPWELLLVDDGSRDASSRIARQAAQGDPARIRYIQHADGGNHGTSASRNLGAAHARGDYLLFLDCDDLLLPTNLARQAAILDADPDLAAAFSPTLFWLWDRAYADDYDCIQAVGAFGERRINPPALLVAMLEDESLHPANCGTLLRREVFTACGGFDVSFRGMYEDTALLTKLLLRHPTYMLSDCLSAYRAHRASQCNAAREAGEYATSGPSPSRRNYLQWAQAYVGQQAPADRAVIAAIERELGDCDNTRPAQSLRHRLTSLQRRTWRRVRRWIGGKSSESLSPVLTVLQTLHSTYLQMHREREAAAVIDRIAELELR